MRYYLLYMTLWCNALRVSLSLHGLARILEAAEPLTDEAVYDYLMEKDGGSTSEIDASWSP